MRGLELRIDDGWRRVQLAESVEPARVPAHGTASLLKVEVYDNEQ